MATIKTEAEDSSEIDLYGNIDNDEDFHQENIELSNEDLYDDVITSGGNDDSKDDVKSNASGSISLSHSGKRVAMYVGNLTWWTTDQDLVDACQSVGIIDVLEIKFHENRQNGQSKGFCVMVFGSDKSAKDALSKLPTLEIHNQTPMVTYCNKQNLNYFEQATGGGSNSTNNSGSSTNNGIAGSGSTCSTQRREYDRTKTDNKNGNRQNTSAASAASANSFNLQNSLNNVPRVSMPTPMMPPRQMPPGIRPPNMPMGLPTLPGMPPSPLHGMPGAPPGALVMPPGAPMHHQFPGAPPGMLPPGMFPPGMIAPPGSNPPQMNPNFAPPTNQSNPPPTSAAGSLPGLPLSQPPGPTGQPGHPAGVPMTQFDPFGRPVASGFPPGGMNPGMVNSSGSKMSESEFDEVLQRNKTVSSSAINRAVQDAASGDYASAIETLVTAISLIKQSKIASDDRCKILINSLQDTLHGIESKSYGAKSSRRRRRSFSNSGSDSDHHEEVDIYSSERSTNRHSGKDRSGRSRSRDRESSRRDRVRERERDYVSNSRSERSREADYYGGSSGSMSGGDRYRESRYRH